MSRTHVSLPTKLRKEIDRRVGERGRSEFIAQAAARELLRLKQLEALQRGYGAWKDENHPELHQGSVAWVRKLRRGLA